jgi:hypothetical protein
MAMTSDPREAVLVIWTITYNTLDHPGRYVVHGHDVLDGTTRPHAEPIFVGESGGTLEDARRMIPRGSVCMQRDPSDDPVIVESWI